MRKIAILASMLYSSILLAQQVPTGPTTPTGASLPQLAQHAWYRGGNFAGAAGGTKNIFGTMAGFNSPIYTYTNGVNRMVVNGSSINCFTLQPLYGVDIV